MTDRSRPPTITGIFTLFYYRDLVAARDWYESRLGFERTTDFAGVVIFRIHKDSHLVLVAADFGSQRPIRGRNKGVVLSIQTDELESWHRRLAGVGVEGTESGIRVGAGGRTREFKVYDPEGYSLEFFEWTA
jgi:catechol 2,3-dioxygenase-like lactoylglutathione lyase family enzyme